MSISEEKNKNKVHPYTKMNFWILEGHFTSGFSIEFEFYTNGLIDGYCPRISSGEGNWGVTFYESLRYLILILSTSSIRINPVPIRKKTQLSQKPTTGSLD